MRAPCAGTWVHFSVLKSGREEKGTHVTMGSTSEGVGNTIYLGKTGSCLIL